MSRTGVPVYKRDPEERWYYWIDGKQGYPTGSLRATTRTGALRRIKSKHPGCAVDEVLIYDQYHGLSEHCPLDRR